MTLPTAVIDDLNTRFSTHAVGIEQAGAMADVRHELRAVAQVIAETVPPGREQALAITKLEEAVFWANAGIARHGSA